MSIRKEKVKVYEMTCTSCENRVERAVKKLEGVLNVKASYSGQYAEIEYDDALCSQDKIKAAVKAAGYSTQASKDYKFMGVLVIIAAIVFLGFKTGGIDMDEKLANASYAVLFVVGILTSIHCVGMCGGIMLSQSLSKENTSRSQAVRPALLYNFGRVISYTVLGGIVGALGSVVALSIHAKAAMEVFAGIFMIMMGFNMAGFSLFRRFHIRLPHAACKAKNKSKSPLIVGLLNGLMPCGPLQTMQLFALGTGSPIKGALSMFVFALGTVPLMLTFGALSSLLSKDYSKKILKFSGVLVIILGLIMGQRGLALAGINANPLTAFADTSKSLLGSSSSGTSNPNIAKATLKDGVQVINMVANNNGYSPNAFYVQKGIPVKWVIDGQELNSCNNNIVIPSLNKQQKLKKGENVIEFTPGDKDINFSCWMGMIRGVIKVTDKLDTVDTSKPDSSIPPPSTGPSCCASPVTDGSGGSSKAQPSIYGDDLSKVPTEVLVNKAISAGKYQTAKFIGKGYELQPLIVVTGSGSSTRLTFDMTAFDKPEGNYTIVDVTSSNIITSFTGKKGVFTVDFTPKKTGGYAVLKDDGLLGVIEVVDNLKTVDLEKIRQKYMNSN